MIPESEINLLVSMKSYMTDLIKEVYFAFIFKCRVWMLIFSLDIVTLHS